MGPARLAAIGCLLLLFVSPAMADYDETEDVVAPPPRGETGDGEDSGGGFFKSLFGGGDTLSKFNGRFIETIERDGPPSVGGGDPEQTGLQLLRRESLGRDMVPVPLEELQRYCEEIVRRLLDAGGITRIEPKVYITAQDRIHGAAYPDGSIFVTLGSIRNFDSEDELAALLAHEVSHVILAHHGSDWFMDSQKRGLAAFQLGVAIKSNLEKLTKTGDGTSPKDQLKMALIGQTVLFASEVLIDSPFTRGQEDESDLLGTDLMIAAKYNPDGMAALLEKLADQEAAVDERAKKIQAERQRLLQNRIEERGAGGIIASAIDVLGSAAKSLKSAIKREIGAKHRAAEQRREQLSEYLEREYEDLEPGEMEADAWKRAAGAPAVVAALAGYRDVLEARNALAIGDFETATARTRKALGRLTAEHALPRLVAGEISAAAGYDGLAALYFRESLAASWPTISAYTGLAALNRRAGDLDAGKNALDRAAADLGDAPHLLPHRITHARLAGAKEKADRSAGKPAAEPASPPAAVTNKMNSEIAAHMVRCKLEAIESLFEMCAKAKDGRFDRLARQTPGARLAAAKAGPLLVGRRFVRVTVPRLNARKGPGTSHAVVQSYKLGAPLMVVSSEGKWDRVWDASGRMIWIANWLTTPTTVKDLSELGVAQRPVATSTEPTVAVKPAPSPAAPPTEPTAVVKQAPPARAVGTTAKGDPITRLRRLKLLRDEGLITEEEYAAKRTKILDEL